VAVIFANGRAAGDAKLATATIPIVFATAADPVGNGLVRSLSRPGGNLSGATTLGGELGPKRVELLHELIPRAIIMAGLITPDRSALFEPAQKAARTLGLQLHVLNASTERDFDPAFATLAQLQAGGLVIATDGYFLVQSELLAAHTLRHLVPAVFAYHEFAAAGGLMSYGGSLAGQDRQVGVYTGRILKGEKPADLPVQQSTKFELIVNLKTAKALGLTVPQLLLGRADEIIE
jgi:putative tryptophan/tyrosine transport system substrate-binding protein